MKVYEVVKNRFIDAYSGDEWAEETMEIFSSLEKVKEAGYFECKEWEVDGGEYEYTFYRFRDTWERAEEYSVYFKGRINWEQVHHCDEILPASYVEQVTDTHIDWHGLRFLDEIDTAVAYIKHEWGDVHINICKGEEADIQIFDDMTSEWEAVRQRS